MFIYLQVAACLFILSKMRQTHSYLVSVSLISLHNWNLFFFLLVRNIIKTLSVWNKPVPVEVCIKQRGEKVKKSQRIMDCVAPSWSYIRFTHLGSGFNIVTARLQSCGRPVGWFGSLKSVRFHIWEERTQRGSGRPPFFFSSFFVMCKASQLQPVYPAGLIPHLGRAQLP